MEAHKQDTLPYGLTTVCGLADSFFFLQSESTEKRVFHDVVSAIQWSPLIRLNKIGKELECELCTYLSSFGLVV